MIKLMKYLKKSAGYIVLIIGLLFLQAYCDLSLPDYTSKLGNVRVKEEIFHLKQERLNREFLSEADIFQKYIDIAFADITDYMTFGTEI